MMYGVTIRYYVQNSLQCVVRWTDVSLSFLSLSLFSFSRRLSMRSSLARWWTSSLSSTRALRSSESWSVLILRLLAITWRDLQRWTQQINHGPIRHEPIWQQQKHHLWSLFQTIGNVLLSYADIITKDFPNHCQKEKVVRDTNALLLFCTCIVWQ